MGETVGDAPPVTKAKPTILVPPRGLLFANGSSPGFSPGPMTLVSSLFPEQGPFSFSQLLAGTLSSTPTAAQPPPPPQPESFSPLFMVPPGLNLTGYLSPLQSPFGMSHQQALAHVTAQAALSQSFKQMQAEFYHSSSTHPSDPSANHLLDTSTPNSTSNHLSSEPDSSKSELISETSPSDKSPADKPANDSYNWRKYGQKQVKASECPRSYYKCSNLGCPVKKKVGRALDGRVAEVTYKGEHNHDVPKLNKRAKDSCASDKTNVASQDRIEINGLKEASNCINSNNNDKEDNPVIVDKDDEDEPIAKKRSVDIVPASSHQAVSESKIVLQTRSEVDLLDDGYKWRKYGQKVVKGNPYPRSYYRCTYAGCNVRKHVERASVDPKAVITTYEGKHNHDIPTGRHMGAQQLKKQKKTASKNLSIKEEINCGDDKDKKIPVTLQLKE